MVLWFFSHSIKSQKNHVASPPTPPNLVSITSASYSMKLIIKNLADFQIV